MPATAPTEPTEPASCPHLGPMCGALLAAAALLWGVQAYVAAVLPARLPFYAVHEMSFKVNANVLQDLAFRTPRELPIYGSSELDLGVEHRADLFFRHRPTGFAVFPVGRGGATCLMILQKLAATGSVARGKTVVIFLSSSWFLQPSVDPRAVAANLSGAQLSAWIFGDDLSRTLKADISRRLRDFAPALQDLTLTADAVRCLAAPSVVNRLHFALLYPLGKIQNALLERFDYGVLLWEMVFPQRRFRVPDRQEENPAATADGTLNWDRLIAAAEAEAGSPGAPEPLGIAPGSQDGTFLARLQASQEFADLALLLRVLAKLQMKALFINQPFDGAYSNSLGYSAQARRAYYDRLHREIEAYGFPVLDFSAHEADRSFFHDVDHPSAKAWIYYDRAIDEFYHRQHPARPL